MRLFLGIEPIVVSSSCRNVRYRSSSRPVAGTFTYRPSSRPVTKVTHILSYPRNIFKLSSNTHTLEKVRGSLFKCIEKRKRRFFCVQIEPASLQGLKSESSNKIGSRNRHQSLFCVKFKVYVNIVNVVKKFSCAFETKKTLTYIG